MLGITNFNWKEHKEIIENFFALARVGKTLRGDPRGHLDGWGIGYYKNGAARLIKSAGSCLEEKTVFFNAVKNAGTSSVLIVHLRKSAWPQTTAKRNAHPFLIDNNLFAHNGTVRDYQRLLAHIPPRRRPRASALDSEVLFSYIMNSKKSDITDKLAASLEYVRDNCAYSALNTLLTDGKTLMAFRDYTIHAGYYSLFHAARGGAGIVCSEPVSGKLNPTFALGRENRGERGREFFDEKSESVALSTVEPFFGRKSPASLDEFRDPNAKFGLKWSPVPPKVIMCL